MLIPLIAALFAGKRPSLAKVLPAGLACLLLVSTVVHSYRLMKWENVRPAEVAREFSTGGIDRWLAVASDEPTHRFHGFDSLLLTVALVPSLEPYSERNVLLSPLVRGVVPRFFYSGKSGADAGINFGARIWAFDDPAARENSGASIAPSMPGDLYDAGGVLYIALGALIWGTLLGLVDGWKGHLPAFCGAAITVLVATQCAMSVERDFDNSVATFIQTLLVFVLVAGVLTLARRGSAGLFAWVQSQSGASLANLMTSTLAAPSVPQAETPRSVYDRCGRGGTTHDRFSSRARWHQQLSLPRLPAVRFAAHDADCAAASRRAAV